MPDEQAARLDRFARSVSKSAKEATAQLIDEGLRHAEFPQVEFRLSASGREAYVVGSSLAVWEVAMVARSHDNDAQRIAAHLRWPVDRVETVLGYADAYPEEIVRALAENDIVAPEDLKRLLPSSHWM